MKIDLIGKFLYCRLDFISRLIVILGWQWDVMDEPMSAKVFQPWVLFEKYRLDRKAFSAFSYVLVPCGRG
jgi:hypothetical protein